MQELVLKGSRLSLPQSHLWPLTTKNAQQGNLYTVQCTIALDGTLNITALQNALQQVVQRHEILHTIYSHVPGMELPVQVVAATAEISCEVINLEKLAPIDQQAWIDEMQHIAQERQFDLKTGPVLHASIVKLSAHAHILHLCLPALCADSASLKYIMQELYHAYTARLSNDEDDELLQYADVSAWQRELLQEDDATPQQAYWNKIDLTSLATLRIPFEQSARRGQDFQPQVVTLATLPGTGARVERMAQNHNVTSAAFLLSCWQVFGARVTSESEIIMGVACNGRHYEELATAIGPYTRMVPLRTSFEEEQPFSELLQRVDTTLALAIKRQLYFHWELISANLPSEQARLFPLGFEFECWPAQFEVGAAVHAQLLHKRGYIEPFVLKLDATQIGDELHLAFHYDASCLPGDYMQHLASCFNTLLVSALNQPELLVGQLEILAQDVQQQLLTLYTETQATQPLQTSFQQLFEQQVARTPELLAVAYKTTELTYKELNAEANQIAHWLRRQGVGPDTLVGLCMERSVAMIVSLLAILKSGAAYVPMDPEMPASRLAYILQDTQATIVLTQESLLPRLPEWNGQYISKEQFQNVFANECNENPLPINNPENLAYVIYTSGSTGIPKGVLIKQESLVNYTSQLLRLLAPEPGLQFATVSTLAADLGNTAIFCSLASGGCLHVLDYDTVTSGSAFADYIASHPIDVLKIVPSHFNALLHSQNKTHLLPRKHLILGGEALSTSLLRELRTHNGTCKIWNHYGPTEATIGALVNPINDHQEFATATVPIGRPLANMEAYVLDRYQRMVPIGMPGELYIGGIGLAREYLNLPEQTRERFITHPYKGTGTLYKTGDLVRHTLDNVIEFLGRIDNQVKLRGYRIELGEIEATLEKHPSIHKSVVIMREDVPGEQRLVAYLVATQQPAPTSQELRQYVRERLPEYMVPSHIVMLQELPLTTNGKIDKRQLTAPEQHRDHTVAAYDVARGPIEEALVELWKELLKVPALGIHDNFFTLGGHSLMATQLISQLRANFGVDLPIRTLFDASTIAQLAGHVEAALRTDEQNAIVPPLTTISREGPLPVSFAQQRLWFLHQLDPASTAYNKTQALHLEGDLNELALEASLSEIVRRHESLRTTFTLHEGEPVQIIHPFESFTLHHLHLTHSDEASDEDQLAHLLSRETAHAFDLEQGPLFRATLIHQDAQQCILVLSMHHVVSDGWSNAVLLHELTELYRTTLDNLPSPLATLPIQYADFSHWQRAWLQGSLLDAQVQYWQQQLAGVPPLLLPTDAPRPPRQTFAGAHIVRSLPPELVSALKTLSQQEGVTFFMTLLATFQLLLARLSGQRDLAVGTPIANRTRSELEGLIGFFVNTLVLRTDLSGHPSFRTLLQRVHEVALGAYAHQDLPFEKLVQLLQPERDLSRSPFFQALFVLQQAPFSPDALPGLSVNLLPTEESNAKFDLTLALTEFPQEMQVTLEYNTDLFSTERMQRLLDTWYLLLQTVLSNPEQAIWSLPLLSPSDQERLHAWNATQQPYPLQQGLPQRISEQAALTPNRIALVFEEHSLSYDALERRSNQLAHVLHNHGVEPEHLVGVCLPRSLELVIALVAILKAGAAYVPLDPSYPAERLQMMTHDADLSVLLSSSQISIATQLDVPLTLELDDWHAFASFPEQAPATFNDPELLAYMIYTSGSTGTPKGALNSQRGICNRLLWMQETYQLQADDRVLQKTPMSFDVSVWEFFWPLLTGACLVLARPEGHRDTRYLRDLLSQEAITTLHFVPSMLHLFIEEDALERCDSVRRILCSGEALPLPLQQRTYERLPWIELHNLYGPTEAAVDVTFWQCPQEETGRAVPIGRPIANTQIHLLDPLGQPVPIGAIGELYIGGINVGRGYWRRGALTAERFVPDPWSREPGARLYRTGDLACYREDGVIDYLGRIDSQIKIRGQRIELAEVEAILARQPAVQECAVIVQQRTASELMLIGYVVAQQGSRLEGAELRTLLREQVPEAMVPAFIQVLPALPLLPNGKIDRKTLTTLEIQITADNTNYAAPRNPLEEMLAELWQDVLGGIGGGARLGRGGGGTDGLVNGAPTHLGADGLINGAPTHLGADGLINRAPTHTIMPIGIHDNFFNIGGHSLLAAQLVARIRSVLQIDLPLRDFFEAPTIAELSQRIEYMQHNAHAQQLPARITARDPEQDNLPLSFAQQRLWFIHQLEPTATSYNMPLAITIQGPLDSTILQQSLQQIVQRHESLRTTFSAHEGRPIQIINPTQQIELTIIDMRTNNGVGAPFTSPSSHTTPSSPNATALTEHINNERQRPFDLTNGPVFRATLYILDTQEHVLLLTMHHIVSDGWSLGVLCNEFTKTYEALAQQQPAPFSDLALQYADFALWQRQWLTEEVLAQKLTYWQQQLAGAPSQLALPTDHARTSTQNNHGSYQEIVLARALLNDITTLSQQHNATLFMTLLAALKITLYHWTQQNDIVIGTVVANRTQAETEPLIGCFMNFLPLRSQVNDEKSAEALLSEVKTTVLNAYMQQDTPFDKLVEALKPDRRQYHNPFYNVALLVQNFPWQAPVESTLHYSILPLPTETALLDLRLIASETTDGLSVLCEYDTDLFDTATVTELLESFRFVLQGMTEQLAQPIASFTITEPLARQAQAVHLRDRQQTIAIAATFTAEPIEDTLAYWMHELDIPARIEFAPYNQVFQQLLDPTSLFAHNQQGVNVILLRIEDWLRFTAEQSGQSELPDEKITGYLHDFIQALQSATRQWLCPCLVCLCPPSPLITTDAAKQSFFMHIEELFVTALSSTNGVYLIKSSEINTLYPVEELYDPYADQVGHVPFTAPAFAALGTLIARKIYALRSTPYKVIALDCDQTLWQGVCGEDGPHGIVIDGPRRALQEFMLAQKDAGILLCLCSKNSSQDVYEVFAHHPEMPLKLEHFVSNRINWQTKSENLRSLAQELNLSLDSFILIDDNPLECAEVQANAPEVLTFTLPTDVMQLPHALEHFWAFDHLRVTTEDKKRTALYEQHLRRIALMAGSPTLGDFLERLELSITIAPLQKAELSRVAQLTQRTNQFNCTTQRRNEHEIQQFCQEGGTCLVVHVQDRFGDYGLVGVVLYNTSQSHMQIDTFLLSCRALGRGVEHHILAHLGTLARENSLTHVMMPFIPTAKNKPAHEFLASVGAAYQQPSSEQSIFAFPVEVIVDLTYQPSDEAVSDNGETTPSLQVKGEGKNTAVRADSARLLKIATHLSTTEQVVQALRTQKRALPSRGQPLVAPRSLLEEQLVALWQELLNLEQVGIYDNFFELGGHSLLATQLISRMRAVLQVEVPLRCIFDAPTIAEQALLVVDMFRQRDGGEEHPLVAVARTEEMPLSFAQQRLWFLHQMMPESPVYNDAFAIQLSGELNIEALQQSLLAIVQRHETLRTTFPIVRGEAVQHIGIANKTIDLVMVDLTHLTDNAQEEMVRALVTKGVEMPFDLEQGPLLRASLFTLNETKYVLLLVMHHIISDGWSHGVLKHELTTLYKDFVQGKPSSLPLLPIQYADFATWQRTWLQGAELEQQLHYWQEQLAGVQPLDLPTDHPRPTVQTFNGASTQMLLPQELVEQLRAISQRENATLFMTLLAAFQILLHRYTGQEDIAVGIPIANRNRVELEGLIGFFVNTLVMRTYISADANFKTVLQQVRTKAMAAYAHQDVPFEKLVEALQPERDLSRTPLFQVMFQLQNTPSSSEEVAGLTISPLEQTTRNAKFDLAVQLHENKAGLLCEIEYNTDLFEQQTIKQLLHHWQIMLAGIVAQPEQHVHALPLLTSLEQQQILQDWNATQTPPSVHACIHELVEEIAKRTPMATAIVGNGVSMTYKELNDRAQQLACYLGTRGVGPETLVGVYMTRSLEMVVGMLGILKTGAAYVPIDPAYPAERIAFMLHDTQALLVLTQSHLVAHLPATTATVICLDSDWSHITSIPTGPVHTTVTTSNLAYVIYTSGSTGVPKGVGIEHAGLLNLITWHKQAFKITSEDRTTHLAGLGFDASVWELWPYLATGASVFLVDDETRISPDLLHDWLIAQKISVTFLPTPLAESMLDMAWEQATTLRLILTGGDKLHRYPPSGLPFELVNNYGPTENTVVSTSIAVPHMPHSEGAPTIGRPIANTEVYILDASLSPVPIGVPGELYVGGASLARGYLKRADLTAERFFPDPFASKPGARLYRTGDLARYRYDGTVEFLGRLDTQVKVRGYRIEVGEIETVLLQYPSVRDVLVTVHEESNGQKQLVAYIVAPYDPALTIAELRQYLHNILPEYMVPAHFVILDALPLTAHGKVDRRALPVPGNEQRENIAGPRTMIEEIVTDLWSELLGAQQVSVEDNFFESGGHSLLATQLVSRVRAILHVDLPLHAFFANPTVAGIAAQIETLLHIEQKIQYPPIVAASHDGEIPLSFAQMRLWFLEQMNPATSSYNIPLAVHMQGTLDIAALQQSLHAIEQRHAILRTSFAAPDGRPRQIISAETNTTLAIVDLQQTPATLLQSTIQRFSAEEARKPFDLTLGPLFRIVLLCLPEQEYILLLTLHHIIADAWSLGIVVQELMAHYSAFVEKRPVPLPPLPIQYADYALWQRQWLEGATMDAHLAYWRNQLRGARALELPTDHPRATIRHFQGSATSFTLPGDLLIQVQQLSQRSGATLFMTLLSAFQVLLARISEQDDIVVGTDIANRTQVETEPLIGFFVNLLALRARLAGHPTFHALLQQVRQTVLDAYLHQDTPFDMLIDSLRIERHANQTPLVQVLLVLQNTPSYQLTLPELTVRALEGEAVSSKFDLAVFLSEANDGTVRGTVNYSTDLFEQPRVDLWMHQYETLLRHLCADPDVPVDAVSLLTQEERDAQELAKQSQRQGVRQSLRITRGARVNLDEVSGEGNG